MGKRRLSLPILAGLVLVLGFGGYLLSNQVRWSYQTARFCMQPDKAVGAEAYCKQVMNQ